MRMSDTIRVLIIDREPLFRRGLAGCLAMDNTLDLVGAGSTAEEGYRLADECVPDVLLVGTTLSDATGLSAATSSSKASSAVAAAAR